MYIVTRCARLEAREAGFLVFYKRDIMQIFSADATMFLKMFLKHEKTPSKVVYNRPIFFQYCQPAQNQPKSIKIAHRATYV